MQIVAYLAAWLTTIGGLWFLFEKADETLAPEVRRRVSIWLVSPSHEDGPFWPNFFVLQFDRLFGSRHLSWRCFSRSVAASMVTVWIVALLWLVASPPDALIDAVGLMMGVTLMGFVFNLIPDYISLLETRFLLGKAQESRKLPSLLMLDVVATTALAASGYALMFFLLAGPPERITEMMWEVVTLQSYLTLRSETGDRLPVGLFFYSTFFTSVWVWLFASSRAAYRGIESMRRRGAFLWRLADVEQKPFRALGLGSILIVTLGFIVAAPAILILGAGAG